jgi:hypothetical protein
MPQIGKREFAVFALECAEEVVFLHARGLARDQPAHAKLLVIRELPDVSASPVADRFTLSKTRVF